MEKIERPNEREIKRRIERERERERERGAAATATAAAEGKTLMAPC